MQVSDPPSILWGQDVLTAVLGIYVSTAIQNWLIPEWNLSTSSKSLMRTLAPFDPRCN